MKTIKELRESTGMYQADFAKRFGIPLGTLANWEQGHRTPPPYIPFLISKILELEAQVNSSK